ncbi:MAG: hypothetical protein N2691_00830 [Patescibacteria group bacterium]|nr:hypothetical protein [Patescibacteria group bacterium]
MTLTEFSYMFRKLAPFAGLLVIILLILYYGIQLIILLTQLNPSVVNDEKPFYDTKFGKIAEPLLKDPKSTEGLEFYLDTIDGVTVTATKSAGVYFMPEPPARFRFRENIYLMARTLGINTELTKYRLEDGIAVFSDPKHRLSVDIKSFNFEYEYLNLANEQSLLTDSRIPGEQEIKTSAVKLMTQLGRYPGELARGKVHIIYLAYNPQTREMTVVDNPDNANLVEVDFYREDIGEYPVATPRYFNSQNYLILVYGKTFAPPKVIKGRVAFFERDPLMYGTYPVKDGDTAFKDLTEGRGFVISSPEAVTAISIKKMIYAYFDPDIRQPYLQPVYVFLGDNNFVAYVPAITAEWLYPATPAANLDLDYSSTVSDATDAATLEDNSSATGSAATNPAFDIQPTVTEIFEEVPESTEESLLVSPTPTRVPNIRLRLSGIPTSAPAR